MRSMSSSARPSPSSRCPWASAPCARGGCTDRFSAPSASSLLSRAPSRRLRQPQPLHLPDLCGDHHRRLLHPRLDPRLALAAHRRHHAWRRPRCRRHDRHGRGRLSEPCPGAGRHRDRSPPGRAGIRFVAPPANAASMARLPASSRLRPRAPRHDGGDGEPAGSGRGRASISSSPSASSPSSGARPPWSWPCRRPASSPCWSCSAGPPA